MSTFIEQVLTHRSDPMNVQWESQARHFAKHGVEFDLVGFNYAHDLKFCEDLACQHGMEMRLSADTTIAHFKCVRPK